MLKNMYTVAGNGPCNEELALRIQAGDKNAAERLVSQNEGYLTELARAYTPWCEAEDLKQEAALALLDAARRFDPAHGTKLLTYATPAIEAALSDYASRYAFPLSVPTSRGSQLRTVAHLCAEAQDTSESELTKAVCEKLKVGRGCPLYRQFRHISRNTAAGGVELTVASEPHKETSCISIRTGQTAGHGSGKCTAGFHDDLNILGAITQLAAAKVKGNDL